MELELNGLLSCFVTQKHGLVGERDECSIVDNQAWAVSEETRAKKCEKVFEKDIRTVVRGIC